MGVPQGAGQRRRRRSPNMAVVTLLVLMVLCALGAATLSPHDPVEQFRDAMLQPPSWDAGGYWLGTDELGRDVLSRLLHGARLTLGIAAGAVFLAAVPGVALGLLAAFYPRHLGFFLLRVADVLLALPGVLLAIAVVAVLGPGLFNTVLAVALSSLPGYVRLARAGALGELARPYVMSARAVGAGPLRLMFRTVLPNCLGPVVVAATLDFSGAILTAAGLGFLGLGAQPPTPEWGAMIANGRQFVLDQWWVAAAPGAAICIVSLAFNLLGDGLRDALDPKSAS